MDTIKIAKQIAEKLNLAKAVKYDLFYRDYDKQIEVLGLVNDPTQDIRDFYGREMLFPKKWVTLAVLDQSFEVTV